jgi:hypothetical protein
VQGTYDAAAKGTLQSEFGTDVDDEVIKIILEKGTLQTSEVSEFHHTHMTYTVPNISLNNRCPSVKDPRMTPWVPWFPTRERSLDHQGLFTRL